RRRAVGPEPDRVGGLPFAVTDIDMVVASGAAPVYPGYRLTFHIGAELPEVLADAATAAAVPASGDVVDDATGFNQQVRQQRGARTGAHERILHRYGRSDLTYSRH